jgi:hypothetical protein
MHLDKFVHSSTGKILMSILLGIGLATFFRTVCKGKHCQIVRAPPMEEIDDQVYKFDGKCYNFEKNAVKCDYTKKVVKIA